MNIDRIMSMKAKQKITMLTAYTYSAAKAIDGMVDMILVGDSGVMVELGKSSTKEATMQEMIIFTKAVKNACTKSVIVSDMPYGSYEDKDKALRNAKKFIDAGADAIKVEGNLPEIIRHLVDNKISVMGHIGLLPQTADKYRIYGKDEHEKKRLLSDASSIQDALAFSIVLEMMPADLSREITKRLKVPTIGIGAGKDCDGQVLVINDILGLYDKFKPKFAPVYEDVSEVIKKAAKKFVDDVRKS